MSKPERTTDPSPTSADTEGGGQRENTNINITKGLTRTLSAANLQNSVLNASKVNALRQSLNRHHDNVSRLLLTSKENLEKRTQIDSAFRACKEAFIELSAAYLKMIESDSQQVNIAETVRSIVGDALSDAHDKLTASLSGNLQPIEQRNAGASSVPSYAAVVSEQSCVRVARGSSIEVPRTTNLIVIPKENFSAKYKTSRETREVLQKTIKPSEYNLKVNRITSAKNNGVRIEALTVNLPKIKSSRELEDAGLRLEQEGKINPRLLIRGVPCTMSREEIKEDLVTLNLKDHDAPELKVVYIFPRKDNRRTTNCVIEVTPGIRTHLLKDRYIFLDYFACEITDYVRVLQCFKCLAFGHFAKDCRFTTICGHCAGGHETRNCTLRSGAPECGNCKRWLPQAGRQHSALDNKNCPILRRRMSERISSINYG
ncbi:uncharacterized protein LOC112457818 [Temnothorax curvispinosus]|uniref:Uncharacterized protein LOC112457818 n=1 Tax=Temnothorax curvispinosus TaxID=300111 RepID=A0A6J1Q5A9_9HYME|nr:uncharacterized protein LOC112457818 [Temnothorax curvispinosus]